MTRALLILICLITQHSLAQSTTAQSNTPAGTSTVTQSEDMSAASVIGPVEAAAWIAGVMSFLILLGVISHNLRMRHAEVDIEKMMGAETSVIRGLIVGEYVVISTFAGLFGSCVAILLTGLVAKSLLDIAPQISWKATVASVAVVVVTTATIAFVSSTRVLHLRGASRKL